MKIWTHRYELKPVNPRWSTRQGALLKIEWVTDQVGYSDLHPWPEFGEEVLDSHLQKLSKLEMTKLAGNSLEFNYCDRGFRLERKNAFAGLILPRSHRLIMDLRALNAPLLQQWHKEGISHIKVKMGQNLPEETPILSELAYSSPILWRLDFNSRVSQTDFINWWEKLDAAVKKRIDFIEDPIDKGELTLPGPWASDWQLSPHYPIRILKPARDSIDNLGTFERVIFTHGMDHALGQAATLWVAANFYANNPRKMEVCGLASPDIYEPDAFSREWSCSAPRLKQTKGFGFGFDAQLAALSWERIL